MIHTFHSCNFNNENSQNYNFYAFIKDIIYGKYGKHIQNYCEIFIKSPIKKIINSKKKRFYFSKSKEIVGVNIKPEFPKRSNIVIKNDFKKNTNQLSKILIKKIKDIV